MKNTKQIANRFREVLLNGTWVANTNLKHQLTDVTLEMATTKIGSLNTIADLTFHINYYVAGLINVFEGGTLDIRDKFSFDLPPLQSEADWEKLKEQSAIDAERFASLVEQMPDSKLEEVFIDEKYGSYQRNIDAMIEHGYYHLGQVVLIKKLLLEKNEAGT